MSREEEEFQGQRYQTAPWTSTAPPMSLAIKPWQLGAWLVGRKRTGTPQVFLDGVSLVDLQERTGTPQVFLDGVSLVDLQEQTGTPQVFLAGVSLVDLQERTGTPQVFLAGGSFCALENGPSKYIHLLTQGVS